MGIIRNPINLRLGKTIFWDTKWVVYNHNKFPFLLFLNFSLIKYFNWILKKKKLFKNHWYFSHINLYHFFENFQIEIFFFKVSIPLPKPISNREILLKRYKKFLKGLNKNILIDPFKFKNFEKINFLNFNLKLIKLVSNLTLKSYKSYINLNHLYSKKKFYLFVFTKINNFFLRNFIFPNLNRTLINFRLLGLLFNKLNNFYFVSNVFTNTSLNNLKLYLFKFRLKNYYSYLYFGNFKLNRVKKKKHGLLISSEKKFLNINNFFLKKKKKFLF